MNEVFERKKMFVFGASGHAKVVIDIIERQGLFDIAFLVDDDPALKGTEFYGYPVIGGKLELLEVRDQVCGGIVAIGSNRARINVASWLSYNQFNLVSVIHPSVQLGRGVIIAGGSAIMAGVIINSDAIIGQNVIINTKACIDHDCTINDGVHIAPGAVLCGTVSIGTGTFVCAGATVIPNLAIGHTAIVAAGSTVINNVMDCELVAGSPAKYIKKLEGF